jgi:chemotaxis protein methyltransferase CheR
MNEIPITDGEFEQVRELALRLAGISMTSAKKPLVESRLRRRLSAHGCKSFRDYLRVLAEPAQRAELQTAIDLLTTNETYFFREPKHFDHLRDCVVVNRQPGAKVRVWSAACSSGEEPYTIAMVLAERLGLGNWEIMASDISTRVLERARTAHYNMERARGIPKAFLQKYCLKGTGPQEGTLLVDAKVRSGVQFLQVNLIEPVPPIGKFDAIFLRNVMIYFDLPTKQRVVANLLPSLKEGGYFYVGHAETLNSVTNALTAVGPAIYRKSGASS